MRDKTGFVVLCLLCAGDMLLPVVLGPSYPGYSHLHDTLSTLGATASPVRWLTQAWLVLFGVVLTVWTIAERRRLAGDRGPRTARG